MNNNIHTLITLPLKDLHPFDMNPRLTRNPDYEEIKASIRLRGLDHPPHITQRPGELFYIIAAATPGWPYSMNCGRKPVRRDTVTSPVSFTPGRQKKVSGKETCTACWATSSKTKCAAH